MKIFLPDTNVLVDYGRSAKVRTAIDEAGDKGATFVIAPPTLTELSVGVVKGGGTHFDSIQEDI